MKRRRVWLAILFLTVLMVVPAPSAAAFGTIDSAGQHREHERITRAALSCAGAGDLVKGCFASGSMDLLAGHDREFGAVGAPDSDEIALPAAHCDDADFLEADYPRSREVAEAQLLGCVEQLRTRFDEAVVAAAALLDDDGRIIPAEVNVDSGCRVFDAAEDRAKCVSLTAFGRVLHGSQDFYAHSNWADEADPTKAIGQDNPPGLNLPGPSPVLDMRGSEPPVVPPGLSTGCFVLRDQVPGVEDCTDRVTHAALNKDNGLVDPATGATSGPTTPRGMVLNNFDKAVTGAIEESRRQWEDFQSELQARYGVEQAAVMACALTHDDPVDGCAESGGNRMVLIVVAVGLGALCLIAGSIVVIRRRSERQPR